MVLTPTTTIATLILVNNSFFACMCKILDCNWRRKSTQGAAREVNTKQCVHFLLRPLISNSAASTASLCTAVMFRQTLSHGRVLTAVMAHQHQISDLGGLGKLKLPTTGKKIENKNACGLSGWENPCCFVRKSDDCWLCTKLSGELLSLSLCQAQRASVCCKCVRERCKGKPVALNIFKCLLTEGERNKAPFEVRWAQS